MTGQRDRHAPHSGEHPITKRNRRLEMTAEQLVDLVGTMEREVRDLRMALRTPIRPSDAGDLSVNFCFQPMDNGPPPSLPGKYIVFENPRICQGCFQFNYYMFRLLPNNMEHDQLGCLVEVGRVWARPDPFYCSGEGPPSEDEMNEWKEFAYTPHMGIEHYGKRYVQWDYVRCIRVEDEEDGISVSNAYNALIKEHDVAKRDAVARIEDEFIRKMLELKGNVG